MDISGIRLSGTAGKSVTVRNTMIWDGDRHGIEADEPTDALTIENCSIDDIKDANAVGVYAGNTLGGNVRELENLVKRLVILDDERFIFSEFRSRNVSPAAPAPMLPADAGAHLEDFDLSAGPISLKQIARRASIEAEGRMIAAVLEQTNWNRRKAARILDVSYKTLLYKIRECGLER